MRSSVVIGAICILSMFNRVFAAADLIPVDKYVGEDARFTWQSDNYLEFKFGISNAAQDDIIVNGVLITCVRGSLGSTPNTTEGFYKGRLYFYGDPSPSADFKHFEITRVTVLDEKAYLVAIMDPTSYKFTALRAWNLVIREAPAFNPPLNGSHDVAEDKDFSITCSASGRPVPNVTWGNKTSGSPVAHGTGSATLSLLKIQRHQAGVYQCQAINDARRGAITQDITINVQYPPEITPIQNTTVRAGETITLTCVLAGNPTPSVSWSKAGSGHSTGGNVFTKAGATKADTGQYVCTAVNTVTGNTQTRTASTYVMVKYIPSILPTPPDETVNETDSLKLTCTSDGYPAPTVTWSRDGVVVSRTSVYYSNSVTRSEAGTYTCTATNEMGSDATTVQVTVNYKPEMESSTNNTSSWDRKVLSLQCKARGVPSPHITWYKPGGQPITAGVSLVSGDSQLQVTTTQDAGDYGQYKCRASNLLGSVERLIYVTQWFAPGPPIITVSNIEASSIKVYWAPPSSDGGSPVIDYKVEVDPAKPPREGVAGGPVVISDLTKNTGYTVKVTARNVVGYGEAGTRTIRTKKQGPPSLPFLKPVDNTTTSEEITLEWSKPDENGGAIQAYIVYFMLTFPDGQKMDWTETANITDLSVLSYTFKGMKPGRTYSFLVTAYNQYGESARDYTKARVVQVNEMTTNKPDAGERGAGPGGSNMAAIGGAVGGAILVVLVAGILFVVLRRKRLQKPGGAPRNESQQEINPYDITDHRTAATNEGNGAEDEGPTYAVVDKTKKKKKKAQDDIPVYAEADKTKKRKPGEIVYAELADFNSVMDEAAASATKPAAYQETAYADITEFQKAEEPTYANVPGQQEVTYGNIQSM